MSELCYADCLTTTTRSNSCCRCVSSFPIRQTPHTSKKLFSRKSLKLSLTFCFLQLACKLNLPWFVTLRFHASCTDFLLFVGLFSVGRNSTLSPVPPTLFSNEAWRHLTFGQNLSRGSRVMSGEGRWNPNKLCKHCLWTAEFFTRLSCHGKDPIICMISTP